MSEAPEDPIITITDIRRAGHCPAGARDWFRAHDLDFAAFLKNGLPASVLLTAGGEDGDGLAEQVVERAKGRHGG